MRDDETFKIYMLFVMLPFISIMLCFMSTFIGMGCMCAGIGVGIIGAGCAGGG